MVQLANFSMIQSEINKLLADAQKRRNNYVKAFLNKYAKEYDTEEELMDLETCMPIKKAKKRNRERKKAFRCNKKQRPRPKVIPFGSLVSYSISAESKMIIQKIKKCILDHNCCGKDYAPSCTRKEPKLDKGFDVLTDEAKGDLPGDGYNSICDGSLKTAFPSTSEQYNSAQNACYPDNVKLNYFTYDQGKGIIPNPLNKETQKSYFKIPTLSDFFLSFKFNLTIDTSLKKLSFCNLTDSSFSISSGAKCIDSDLPVSDKSLKLISIEKNSSSSDKLGKCCDVLQKPKFSYPNAESYKSPEVKYPNVISELGLVEKTIYVNQNNKPAPTLFQKELNQEGIGSKNIISTTTLRCLDSRPKSMNSTNLVPFSRYRSVLKNKKIARCSADKLQNNSDLTEFQTSFTLPSKDICTPQKKGKIEHRPSLNFVASETNGTSNRIKPSDAHSTENSCSEKENTVHSAISAVINHSLISRQNNCRYSSDEELMPLDKIGFQMGNCKSKNEPSDPYVLKVGDGVPTKKLSLLANIDAENFPPSYFNSNSSSSYKLQKCWVVLQKLKFSYNVEEISDITCFTKANSQVKRRNAQKKAYGAYLADDSWSVTEESDPDAISAVKNSLPFSRQTLCQYASDEITPNRRKGAHLWSCKNNEFSDAIELMKYNSQTKKGHHFHKPPNTYTINSSSSYLKETYSKASSVVKNHSSNSRQTRCQYSSDEELMPLNQKCIQACTRKNIVKTFPGTFVSKKEKFLLNTNAQPVPKDENRMRHGIKKMKKISSYIVPSRSESIPDNQTLPPEIIKEQQPRTRKACGPTACLEDAISNNCINKDFFTPQTKHRKRKIAAHYTYSAEVISHRRLVFGTTLKRRRLQEKADIGSKSNGSKSYKRKRLCANSQIYSLNNPTLSVCSNRNEPVLFNNNHLKEFFTFQKSKMTNAMITFSKKCKFAPNLPEDCLTGNE